MLQLHHALQGTKRKEHALEQLNTLTPYTYWGMGVIDDETWRRQSRGGVPRPASTMRKPPSGAQTVCRSQKTLATSTYPLPSCTSSARRATTRRSRRRRIPVLDVCCLLWRIPFHEEAQFLSASAKAAFSYLLYSHLCYVMCIAWFFFPIVIHEWVVRWSCKVLHRHSGRKKILFIDTISCMWQTVITTLENWWKGVVGKEACRDPLQVTIGRYVINRVPDHRRLMSN
jgi:hypothetical protein